MNVAIIEDEAPAVEKLERYLKKYDPKLEVLAVLNSVESSVAWLTDRQKDIDLLFADVQLTDGLSFEIFSRVKINLPVIFTTAFDEFAVDAFKVNSIDYLLKPITFTDLSGALKKFDNMKSHFSGQADLSETIAGISKKLYKDRFMVKLGTHIQSIKSEEAVLFYAEGRTVYLTTQKARRYIIEYRLEDLEYLLDPKQFFRANRTYIININCVDDVTVYSNSRLNVKTNPSVDEQIIVSREKVSDFKKWLEGV